MKKPSVTAEALRKAAEAFRAEGKNAEAEECMKKAAEEDDDDDENDGKKKDDDEDEDEDDMKGKKGKGKAALLTGLSAVASPLAAAAVVDKGAEMKEIVELCELAGYGEMANEFVKNGTPLADVRKALVDKKAAAASPMVAPFNANTPFIAKGFSAIEQSANKLMRERNISFAKAVDQTLQSNPLAYAEYRSEMQRLEFASKMGMLGAVPGFPAAGMGSMSGTFQRPGMQAAMPTQYDVHVNQPLTNISVAFIQEEKAFIAVDVFPNVPVQKQSDVYYTYDRASLNKVKMGPRGADGRSPGSGYKVSANSTYNCFVQALHHDIPDPVRANMDSVLSGDRDAAIYLTQQSLIKRELDFNQTAMQNVWTGQAAGGSSATGTYGQAGSTVIYWDNPSSTPIEDVRNAKRIVQTNSGGFRPTDLTLPRAVFDHLQDHPDIIDRIKYTGKDEAPAQATLDTLAQLFEVERVHVMDAVYNSGPDGGTESNVLIGGKNALLSYRPPQPGLLVPTAGYTFTWTGLFGMGPMGTRMKTFREEPMAKDVVEIEAAYDIKVVSADLGFFFTNVTQN